MNYFKLGTKFNKSISIKATGKLAGMFRSKAGKVAAKSAGVGVKMGVAAGKKAMALAQALKRSAKRGARLTLTGGVGYLLGRYHEKGRRY